MRPMGAFYPPRRDSERQKEIIRKAKMRMAAASGKNMYGVE